MPTQHTSSIIRDVLSSRRATPSSASEEKLRLAGEEVWFELELRDPAVEFDPFDSALGMQPRLVAGKDYHVRVSTTRRKKNDVPSVDASRPVEIKLLCEDVPEIGISNPRRTIEARELATLDETFEITVPFECQTGDYYFRLKCFQGRGVASVGATLAFSLQGTLPDSGLITKCRVALGATSPKNTAILHIERSVSNQYRLRGWSSTAGQLSIDRLEPPALGLADFVEQELEPEYIKGNLSSFSRRNSIELLDWFDRLFKYHGKDFCLIIADHSSSELPWEMIEIEQGKYLGAIWRVVRWIPVQDFLIWQNLSIEDEERYGEVLAYLNDEELNVDMERNALNLLSTSYCDTPARLSHFLSQPLNAVALVYLGCHGIFTYSDKHKIALGELKNPSNRFVSLSVEAIRRHEGARPLLFVNACHSARLIRDGSEFYGLPEVFLAKIAGSYLGTLGPVGSEYAAKIASFIFSEAIGNKIEPAEMLRQLRAKAVEQLAVAESEENWLNFIYAFMYVYYGNPFIKIKLVCAAEPKGNE